MSSIRSNLTVLEQAMVIYGPASGSQAAQATQQQVTSVAQNALNDGNTRSSGSPAVGTPTNVTVIVKRDLRSFILQGPIGEQIQELLQRVASLTPVIADIIHEYSEDVVPYTIQGSNGIIRDFDSAITAIDEFATLLCRTYFGLAPQIVDQKAELEAIAELPLKNKAYEKHFQELDKHFDDNGQLILVREILRIGASNNLNCKSLIRQAHKTAVNVQLTPKLSEMKKLAKQFLPLTTNEQQNKKIQAENGLRMNTRNLIALLIELKKKRILIDHLYLLYQQVDQLAGLGSQHIEFQKFNKEAEGLEKIEANRSSEGSNIFEDDAIWRVNTALVPFEAYFLKIFQDLFVMSVPQAVDKLNSSFSNSELDNCNKSYLDAQNYCIVPTADEVLVWVSGSKASPPNPPVRKVPGPKPSVIEVQVRKLVAANGWDFGLIFESIRNSQRSVFLEYEYYMLGVYFQHKNVQQKENHLQKLGQLLELKRLKFRLEQEYAFYLELKELIALGKGHPAFDQFNQDIQSGFLFELFSNAGPSRSPVEWILEYRRMANEMVSQKPTSLSTEKPEAPSAFLQIKPIGGSYGKGLQDYYEKCSKDVVVREMWEHTKHYASQLMRKAFPEYDESYIEYIESKLIDYVNNSYDSATCDKNKLLLAMIVFIQEMEKTFDFQTTLKLRNPEQRRVAVDQIFKDWEKLIKFHKKLNEIREKNKPHFNVSGTENSFSWRKFASLDKFPEEGELLKNHDLKLDPKLVQEKKQLGSLNLQSIEFRNVGPINFLFRRRDLVLIQGDEYSDDVEKRIQTATGLPLAMVSCIYHYREQGEVYVDRAINEKVKMINKKLERQGNRSTNFYPITENHISHTATAAHKKFLCDLFNSLPRNNSFSTNSLNPFSINDVISTDCTRILEFLILYNIYNIPAESPMQGSVDKSSSVSGGSAGMPAQINYRSPKDFHAKMDLEIEKLSERVGWELENVRSCLSRIGSSIIAKDEASSEDINALFRAKAYYALQKLADDASDLIRIFKGKSSEYEEVARRLALASNKTATVTEGVKPQN